jgi:aminopeptidase C
MGFEKNNIFNFDMIFTHARTMDRRRVAPLFLMTPAEYAIQYYIFIFFLQKYNSTSTVRRYKISLDVYTDYTQLLSLFNFNFN